MSMLLLSDEHKDYLPHFLDRIMMLKIFQEYGYAKTDLYGLKKEEEEESFFALQDFIYYIEQIIKKDPYLDVHLPEEEAQNIWDNGQDILLCVNLLWVEELFRFLEQGGDNLGLSILEDKLNGIAEALESVQINNHWDITEAGFGFEVGDFSLSRSTLLMITSDFPYYARALSMFVDAYVDLVCFYESTRGFPPSQFKTEDLLYLNPRQE